jgi:hypothetical protein
MKGFISALGALRNIQPIVYPRTNPSYNSAVASVS